jgi:hypothetical protein
MHGTAHFAVEEVSFDAERFAASFLLSGCPFYRVASAASTEATSVAANDAV